MRTRTFPLVLYNGRKLTELGITVETEGQVSHVSTDKDEYGATVKVGGDVKVVEISGEGAYKYAKTFEDTTMDGSKQVKVMKFAVKALDPQRQPTITAVKP